MLFNLTRKTETCLLEKDEIVWKGQRGAYLVIPGTCVCWLESVEFIEASLFTRLLPEYLTDDEYAQLQLHLANDPEAGDVIPGTGGFRKVRWGDPRRGQRKTRGLRVIYYLFLAAASFGLSRSTGRTRRLT